MWKVNCAEGERLYLLDGEIAQLWRMGVRIVGDESKAIAGGHQGVNGLMVVAKQNLTGGSSAYGLGLDGKEIGWTDRRAAHGDAPGGLELLHSDTAVGSQRMAVGTDTSDRTFAELYIPRFGHSSTPEGEHELDGALLQQIFHGVKGDKAQHRQYLRL